MGRMFGTDGIRGVAGKDITCELAFRLGQAGAHVLTKGEHHPLIVAGMDTRLSSGMLECALVAGMLSVGAHVKRVGVVPTPCVAFLTRHYKADAGAMISASHNPFDDNGIKFFSSDGYKLPDALEDEVEARLRSGDSLPGVTGEHIGVAEEANCAKEYYIRYLLDSVGPGFEGRTIALDCANGAASEIGVEVFRRAGVDVMKINALPDGVNINKDCGSTHPEALQEFVRIWHPYAGFAFDGDADRVIAVDDQGDVVDGDAMMAILAWDMHAKGKLTGNAVVSTVMSNMGLELALKEEGIALERAAVGDRYVLERMLEKGYVLGGEQSGHIILKEHATTGDGLLTALHMLNVFCRNGPTLSSLNARIKHLPQVLIGVRVDPARRADWESVPAITDAIRAAEEAMAGKGRVLVRASGTEPLLRVMLEGEERGFVEAKANHIAEVIKGSIGE